MRVSYVWIILCGDGCLAFNEDCDDGWNSNGDGCDYMCQTE